LKKWSRKRIGPWKRGREKGRGISPRKAEEKELQEKGKNLTLKKLRKLGGKNSRSNKSERKKRVQERGGKKAWMYSETFKIARKVTGKKSSWSSIQKGNQNRREEGTICDKDLSRKSR